jgi:hypothetical protein
MRAWSFLSSSLSAAWAGAARASSAAYHTIFVPQLFPALFTDHDLTQVLVVG